MAGVSDIIATLDRLPPLPTSVSSAIAELQREDTDVERLCEIIRRDEALTSAVLAVANSAFYNASGRTFDLRESLVRLGSKSLTEVILERKMSGVFDDAGVAYGVRRHAMWLGSIGGAAAAEKIAQDHGYAQPELCFVSAMLRDIGKLAVDAYVTGRASSLPEQDDADDRMFTEIEQELFGADHAEIGSLLAARWSLPGEIGRAIRGHHAPPAPGAEGHSVLTDIVHAADTVCLWAGLGLGTDGLHYRIAPHVQETYLPDRAAAETYISFARQRAEAIDASLDENRGAA